VGFWTANTLRNNMIYHLIRTKQEIAHCLFSWLGSLVDI